MSYASDFKANSKALPSVPYLKRRLVIPFASGSSYSNVELNEKLDLINRVTLKEYNLTFEVNSSDELPSYFELYCDSPLFSNNQGLSNSSLSNSVPVTLFSPTITKKTNYRFSHEYTREYELTYFSNYGIQVPRSLNFCLVNNSTLYDAPAPTDFPPGSLPSNRLTLSEPSSIILEFYTTSPGHISDPFDPKLSITRSAYARSFTGKMM